MKPAPRAESTADSPVGRKHDLTCVGASRVLPAMMQEAAGRLSPRERQLAAVAHLGLRALEETDLATFLAEAAGEVAGALDVEDVRILELLPDRNLFLLQAGPGRQKAPARAALPIDPHTCAGLALTSAVAATAGDLAARIPGRTQPYGVLAIHGGPHRRFSEDERYFVQTVAHLLGEAVARRKAEAALRQREELLRRMLEHNPDCVQVLDLDGRLQSMNAAGMAQMRIQDFEPLVGSSWIDLWQDEYRESAKQALDRACMGDTGRFIGCCATFDGELKWWDVLVAPIRDEHGRVERLMAVSRDMTEQKRSEASMRFLSEAKMMLASSLDYTQTLTTIARLLVPSLADWCAIDVLEDDGTINMVAVVHADPAKVELVHKLRRRYPSPTESVLWMRHSEPQLIVDVTDEMLTESTQDDEHLRIMQELRPRSAIVAPLVARGRTLGAITLIHAEGARRYTTADLPPIEELARSCALAIDNARLYRAAQHEIAERERAEAEIERLNRDLQHRLEELQTLLDVTPVGLAVAHDPDCNQITANRAFARMLGIRPDQNVSKSAPGNKLPFKVMRNGKEVPPNALPMQYAAKHNTEVRAEEYQIVRSNGEVLTLLEYALPLHDEAGKVRGVLGAFVDITALKRTEQALRESELRFRRLADAMPQLVWSFAPGRPTFLNRQWYAYTGLVPDNPDASSLLSVIHPEDVEQIPNRFREAAAGKKTFELEYRLRRADGVYRWFLSRAVPMLDDDGNIIEWLGTATDIDDQKRAEAQLKELNETLELRVAERTTALEAANNQLMAEVRERERAEQALERTNAALLQSNRELQEFAYVASHDLQEPLRKISSFANLLRSDYDALLDETGRYYVNRMQDAALRMSNLISDLLSFSRITTRGQDFEVSDLNTLVADVLSDLEVSIEETRGQVEVGILPRIEADPTQMRQLFQNLIANALKFRKPDVPPVIRVDASVEVQVPAPGTDPVEVCRIVVEDNGIGFDEKYRDRIFAPFQRLHGRSAYPGTGIGLAICRRIVERHDGSISAHSKPGLGSTFVVVLPLRQPAGR